MTRFEVVARNLKARKMADVLSILGATPATAAALPESHRRIAATLAGCHTPSPATWAAVVELVRADALALVDAA